MTSWAQTSTEKDLLGLPVTPVRTIYRYGTDANSHDLLKVLATATIVVGHTGKFFLDENLWLVIVGKMAAPLLFFLLGYSDSYRFKLQILILGIGLWLINFLTNTSLSLMGQVIPLNILLSFVLIKMVLDRIDPAKQSTGILLISLGVLVAASAPTYLVIEYGTIGLCYAIGARLITQHHPFGRFWICTTVGVHFLLEMITVLLFRGDVSLPTLQYAIPLLASVFFLNLIIFLKYDFRTFTVKPGWMRKLVLCVSRYFLQIYFFHLAAFMIIYRIL